MKLFIGIVILLSFQAEAIEFTAGMREIFVTKFSHTFGGDTSMRVKRALSDAGFNSFSLQMRLAYSGNDDSQVYLPPFKTNNIDLDKMATRIIQGEGKIVFHPIIFKNPGLGVAKPETNISPKKLDVFFASYQQAITNYVAVAKKKEVHEFIIGGGVAGTFSNEKLKKSWNSFFVNLRGQLAPNTKISLELSNSNEVDSLENSLRENGDLAKTLKSLVTTIYFVPDFSRIYTADKNLDVSTLESDVLTYHQMMSKYFSSQTRLGLSRFYIPSCSSWDVNDSSEIDCLIDGADNKKQENNLKVLKEWLQNNSKKFNIGNVELMQALSDFEPVKPDLRYLYFNSALGKTGIYRFETAALPTLPAIEATNSGAKKKVACLFYDKFDLPGYTDLVGGIHATMLESLLGAFPAWTPKKMKMQDYKQGTLDSCDVAFYLSTNFVYKLKEEFLSDLIRFTNKKDFVWTNYKFTSFSDYYKSKMGSSLPFEVPYMIQADTQPSATNEDIGFYKYFDYKGETFFKLSKWDPAANNYAASPELGFINVKERDLVKVHAIARHSKDDNKKVPYVVESMIGAEGGKLWYFADSPLSYVHNEDRFLILCDLLWDILKETAPKEHIALVRIEDVNPSEDTAALKLAVDYLADSKTPFAYALIPYFSDLEGSSTISLKPVLKPIWKFPSFIGHLRYAMNRGVDIVMHGVEHALGEIISGYDGVSGDDYEFWLYPENLPVPMDSVDWVLDRLQRGEDVFKKLGIKTDVWELPHYAASALDYTIFGKTFNWNWHRTVYFPFEIKKDTLLPDDMKYFSCDTLQCQEKRKMILRNIEVEANYKTFGGMVSPYIIFKDAYGQALIPETLGNLDFPFFSKETWRPVSKPADILRRAKKLKVIRGSVASFFWHPYLLNRELQYFLENPGSYEEMGGLESLQGLVDGIKSLGYKFVSIKDCKYFPRKGCAQ